MSGREAIRFGPFRLEPSEGRLWRGRVEIGLGPRAFALLRFFLRHPNRLLSKDEILDAVWSGVHVADGALKVCVNELRRALGDDAENPKFLETVHRRGYRFIAEVASAGAAPGAPAAPLFAWRPAIPQGASEGAIVGREPELTVLRDRLANVRAGRRRTVLVTGEAGIGKTALLDRCLRDLDGADLWVSGGHCHERHGTSEAYVPVLEALSRLARRPEGAPLVDALRRYAPSWVGHLPWLVAERTTDAPPPFATGPERMPRELAEAFESLSDVTLVLVFEDVHWADTSTLDLLCFLARRSDPTRLLVVATSRPADAEAAAERLAPLRALVATGHVDEIRLGPLGEEAFAEVLARRFPGNDFPDELAPSLCRSTGGHPLFLACALDEAVEEHRIDAIEGGWRLRVAPGALTGEVPRGVRELVRLRRDRLSPEDRVVLEAASVAGEPFAAALVADVLATDRDEVEDRCDRLARPGSFLVPRGAEPVGGAVSGTYGFRHAIFQAALYDDLGEGRRARLHRSVADHLEAMLGDEAPSRAAELSLHFERGKDPGRAVEWAVRAAAKTPGAAEAVFQARRGLALLDQLPPAPPRTIERLRLEVALGRGLMAASGYTDPAIERAFARAEALATEVGDAGERARILFGLGHFHMVRGSLVRARELAARGIQDAAEGKRELLAPLYMLAGISAFYHGEFADALGNAREGQAVYDASFREDYPVLVGYAPLALLRVVESLALWMLGFPDQAIRRVEDGIDDARDHPFSLALAYENASWIASWCGDHARALREADRVVELTTVHGFPYWRAWGIWSRACARTVLGAAVAGEATIGETLASLRGISETVSVPRCLAVEAEILAGTGRVDEALRVSGEALARSETTEGVWWNADILRVHGEILLRAGAGRETAGRSLRAALELARAQGSLSLELRAATSLARAAHGRKDRAAALERLATVFARFTEGFDTGDLRAARALLGRGSRTRPRKRA